MINFKNRISHYLDVFYNKYYPPQIFYRKKQRKRIKNKDFSLLTGNCVGGYLYHELGLPFLSPTINLMIENKDFCKFISNIHYYLALEPIAYIDYKYPGVPSARLDDIIIHFTHYPSVEDGIKAWNKRKRRINFDNLYIIMTDIDLSEDDIANLASINCKKIIVLTAHNLKFPHCLYIPEFKGMKQVGRLLGKTLYGKWSFEKYFDFVGWVNSSDPIARHFYIGRYKIKDSECCE